MLLHSYDVSYFHGNNFPLYKETYISLFYTHHLYMANCLCVHKIWDYYCLKGREDGLFILIPRAYNTVPTDSIYLVFACELNWKWFTSVSKLKASNTWFSSDSSKMKLNRLYIFPQIIIYYSINTDLCNILTGTCIVPYCNFNSWQWDIFYINKPKEPLRLLKLLFTTTMIRDAAATSQSSSHAVCTGFRAFTYLVPASLCFTSTKNHFFHCHKRTLQAGCSQIEKLNCPLATHLVSCSREELPHIQGGWLYGQQWGWE